MIRKNNTKNFIWNAIGLTFNSFNSLFFLIAVRYINGVDVAGIFTYAFALCALFYIISIYYNRSFQVSDAKDKFSFSDYLSCRILTSILSFALIIIFALINQFSFFEVAVIALLMIFRIVEAISDCFYGAIHKKSHLYQTGISLTLKAIIGLCVFSVVDFLTKNLCLSITALVAINIIIFLFYDLKNYKNLYKEKLKINFKNIKLILKTCFPVFLFSILSLYLANCQKYILPYFDTYDAQTIFGILIMPATILSLIGSYLINPVLDILTSHHENKNFSAFIKLSKKILLLLLGVGILAITAAYFLGVPVLELIYQLDLSDYRLALVIIVIASIFFAVAMIISSLLTVLKENRRQTYIYIITAATATIISIFFIQSSGVTGAAWSFFISSIILVVLYIALLQIKLHSLRSRYGK
ncbi:polysaccharide biosynthesis C-terminal domain-containing protein [Candidatus Saccharibacteria bacterium]|nr:polysaccharide biosynthesis C-terminal domain-containing protein [Candidatus Saccharibacteria bacterium]